MNNFSGVLNDHGLFNDMKGTPINHNRRSLNINQRQNNHLSDHNLGMDMEDEFSNAGKHNNGNQMDIENFE